MNHDMVERIERNLHDARTGERLTFRALPNTPQGKVNVCRNCGTYEIEHVWDTSIMFCPEWALRERWGK